ncbi:hypothetical protein NDU88_005498 [Pleurodeles waltl]|uniref:Reverse transcriptase domain-containing protein n=1 Tax=Pleurodeles waltl TaxID=8319 RepID=A0AAV7UK73_PLEWA|nr:hypothetical protein NDU88_005498 [Pleurodeles waltl]
MALFYKTFCVELAPLLVRLFNSFRTTGALTPSVLDATIVVIHKPGFTPNRQCGDNTKRLLHLLDKTDRSCREALFLSIDAEKAFDRVHWPYLFKVLERFGLGPVFRFWISCVYRSPRAAVRGASAKSAPRAIATLQSAILKFIWEGRPARLSRRMLYRPKSGGALAIPCLQRYFQVTQLRFLLEWNRPLTEKHWCFMDQAVADLHIWKEPWL